MSRAVLLLLFCQSLLSVSEGRAGQNGPKAAKGSGPTRIEWQTDYGEARQVAEAQQKMMCVWFCGAANNAFQRQFETISLRDPKVVKLLDRYVMVKLSTAATIIVKGKPLRLLDHGAFRELKRGPGIVLIDFAHRGTEYYRHVVTTLPFTAGKYYRFHPSHLAVALNLPAGTLTQRTLIFAVRIHPERPASTHGQIDPNLVKAANSHSHYQSRILVQGHHHWNSRFPRLRRLLFGLNPQEIVAESWPQEGVVDAAVDVVDSWHHSSGHWQAVYSKQNRFGYDMKKGRNGIWYATGLFGNHR